MASVLAEELNAPPSRGIFSVMPLEARTAAPHWEQGEDVSPNRPLPSPSSPFPLRPPSPSLLSPASSALNFTITWTIPKIFICSFSNFFLQWTWKTEAQRPLSPQLFLLAVGFL